MKTKYYTIWDLNAEPRVTVCLVEHKGNAARGLALLSFDDTYSSMAGKIIARQNAIRALKGRAVDPIRTKKGLDVLISCQCPWVMRGERNPILSAHERRLLFGKKWAEKHWVLNDGTQWVLRIVKNGRVRYASD